MDKILLLLLFLIGLDSNAQDDEIWEAFMGEDSTLVGYKDKAGEVKIEPKFVPYFMIADQFENIIAVNEKDGGEKSSYYLTKSGKKVGVDSLYYFDATTDCESEGFIRFEDRKNEMLGLFDKDGNVVIPAEYNMLSQVRNGFVIATKNARKKYWDNHHESGCNHYSWDGGTVYLLNTKNEVIIENFEWGYSTNMFSVKMNIHPNDDCLSKTYQGVNGQFYSFMDYEKEFEYVLDSMLLNDFTKANFSLFCHDSIYYWDYEQGRLLKSKQVIADEQFDLIKEKLLNLNDTNVNYNIYVSSLNPFTYEGKKYEKYFDNCGHPIRSKYPCIELSITTEKRGERVEDRFEFFRTENGYQLISFLIRSE